MRAIALAVLMMVVGCDQGRPTPSREEIARKRAEAESAQAIKDAQDAKAKLDAIIKQLDDLDKKVQAAVDRVVEAETDAERAAAKTELLKLQQEKADLVRSVAEARAAVESTGRRKGVTISKECMDNPLAKGCS